MLSSLGFLTIGVILALLLTNRVAAVVALAGVPVVAALVAGFSPTEIGEFVSSGLSGVVGVATMFVFAIVFFGVMRDAGLFEPIIRRLVRLAGNAPVTVCLATTALAMTAHLDGAGATTFLITIPAMLPLFDRLGMSRIVLTSCVGLGAGVMNLLPWGGPTARAAATTGVSTNELWVPLIPAQIAGMVAVLAIAFWLGVREKRRLAREGFVAVEQPAAERVAEPAMAGGRGGPGHAAAAAPGSSGGPADLESPHEDAQAPGIGAAALAPAVASSPDEGESLLRPKLYWVNAVLTLLTIVGLVLTIAPPELIFLFAVVIALCVNYPGLKAQTARLNDHATGAMLMASTLLAAGAFLGILGESGMIDAMATTAAGWLPASAAPGLPLIAGVLGVPMSLLFGPDAYYFGVLPVLTSLGEQFGVSGIDIAQASLLGEETVGFPISPLTGSFYLLVGLGGVEIGKHIRALIGWAWLVSLIMLAVAIITGAVPLWV
jgi:CitMHS family citrate-Mg2+:H+ or citrate-Ca2+:H+ symporter